MDDPNAGVAPTPTPTPAPTTEPAAPAAEPIAEPTPAPAAPAEEPTIAPQAPVAKPTPVSEPAVTPVAEPAPAVTPAPTAEPAAPAAASVLGQAPAPTPGQPAPAAGKKMSTGLIIGLIAGGLAVVVGLILLFVLVIPAISGPSGKYEIVSYTRSGATYNKEYFDKYDEHLYIDFKGDGKCTVTMKSGDRERSYDCTYGNGKFSSESLSTESNTLNMKSSGNQVILEDDEYKYVFEK